MTEINRQQRIRKESHMFISVNEQIPKINKGERKRANGIWIKQEKIILQEIGTYLSITTLNINGINYPIKRCRLAWFKTHPSVVCKKHVTSKNTD
jgi:hypothetical protein